MDHAYLVASLEIIYSDLTDTVLTAGIARHVTEARIGFPLNGKLGPN